MVLSVHQPGFLEGQILCLLLYHLDYCPMGVLAVFVLKGGDWHLSFLDHRPENWFTLIIAAMHSYRVWAVDNTLVTPAICTAAEKHGHATLPYRALK